jgi:hypothetical protein
MAIGALAEGTIEVMGSEATETILGRIISATEGTATIEGMITVCQEPGQAPVEVEIPMTIRLPIASVTILAQPGA